MAQVVIYYRIDACGDDAGSSSLRFQRSVAHGCVSPDDDIVAEFVEYESVGCDRAAWAEVRNAVAVNDSIDLILMIATTAPIGAGAPFNPYSTGPLDCILHFLELPLLPEATSIRLMEAPREKLELVRYRTTDQARWCIYLCMGSRAPSSTVHVDIKYVNWIDWTEGRRTADVWFQPRIVLENIETCSGVLFDHQLSRRSSDFDVEYHVGFTDENFAPNTTVFLLEDINEITAEKIVYSSATGYA